MGKFIVRHNPSTAAPGIYLVTDPEIQDGALVAKLIGKFDSTKTSNPKDDPKFIHCDPVKIILIGNVSCIEIKNDPFVD